MVVAGREVHTSRNAFRRKRISSDSQIQLPSSSTLSPEVANMAAVSRGTQSSGHAFRQLATSVGGPTGSYISQQRRSKITVNDVMVLKDALPTFPSGAVSDQNIGAHQTNTHAPDYLEHGFITGKKMALLPPLQGGSSLEPYPPPSRSKSSAIQKLKEGNPDMTSRVSLGDTFPDTVAKPPTGVSDSAGTLLQKAKIHHVISSGDDVAKFRQLIREPSGEPYVHLGRRRINYCTPDKTTLIERWLNDVRVAQARYGICTKTICTIIESDEHGTRGTHLI